MPKLESRVQIREMTLPVGLPIPGLIQSGKAQVTVVASTREDVIVHHLNAPRNLPIRTVVAGVVRDELIDPRWLFVLVKRLQTLESRLPAGGRKFHGELYKAQQSIKRMLGRYDAKPDWDGQWREPLAKWKIFWECRGGSPRHGTTELLIVLDILDLAATGRISYLKQCDQCRKWLFAKFSHHRFCSDVCYEQFHRTNEADKKRRREWARENYWTRKSLETGKRMVKTAKKGKRVKKVK